MTTGLLTSTLRQLLSLWLIVTASVFPFGRYSSNEFNKLPLARKAVESDWLARDWYLNLNSDHYDWFNRLLGPMISWLGFETGGAIGRLAVYLLFSLALLGLFRLLRVHFAIALLITFAFLNIGNQSLVAGEWIVGGVESKTVAYALSFIALTAFVNRHALIGFSCAGAALSFHVLTGCYAIFCMGFAWMLTVRANEFKATGLLKSWPFFLTGLGGIQSIFHQWAAGSSVDAISASTLYVTYRNPHHLLPSAWDPGWVWKVELILCVVVFLLVYLRSHSRVLRFVAAYGLGSVVLFLIGLGIWKSGYIHALRYYWFRFPDTIAPLFALMLLGAILSRSDGSIFRLNAALQRGLAGWRDKLDRSRAAANSVLVLLVFMLSAGQVAGKVFHENPSTAEFRLSEQPMLEWISRNTPQDAVFLVDPALLGFYVHAQRAMVVSYKHAPHSNAALAEWYARIKRLNGDRTPEKRGFESVRELSENFYRLDPASIHQIAVDYTADYLLRRSGGDMPFEAIHRAGDYVLYKIPGLR